MRKLDKIIIHCSATRKNQDIGVKEIAQEHKKNGWENIGYHFVIRRNGEIEDGRPIEEIGAHCKGQNKNSIGICLVGGVNEQLKAENNFTPAQFFSLQKLVQNLKMKFQNLTIHGHKEFAAKDCPSFEVTDLFKEEKC